MFPFSIHETIEVPNVVDSDKSVGQGVLVAIADALKKIEGLHIDVEHTGHLVRFDTGETAISSSGFGLYGIERGIIQLTPTPNSILITYELATQRLGLAIIGLPVITAVAFAADILHYGLSGMTLIACIALVGMLAYLSFIYRLANNRFRSLVLNTTKRVFGC